jgi:hypothetical protein
MSGGILGRKVHRKDAEIGRRSAAALRDDIALPKGGPT